MTITPRTSIQLSRPGWLNIPGFIPDVFLVTQPGRAIVRGGDSAASAALGSSEYAGTGERPAQLTVKAWNEDPQPFIWTKTAEYILDSIARYLKRINGAGH